MVEWMDMKMDGDICGWKERGRYGNVKGWWFYGGGAEGGQKERMIIVKGDLNFWHINI